MPDYGVRIGREFEREFADMPWARNVPMEQIIRDALAIYVYLNQETADGKKKVSITDAQDRVLQDIEIHK